MVGADQPLLQVPNGAVRQRHHGRGAFPQGAPERLSPGHVRHARGLQPLEAFQAVGVDGRPRRDVALNEIDHRGLFEVRGHRHPNPARDAAPLFDGDQHNGGLAPFELTTPPQAGLGTTDPGVVDFHRPMQRLARHIDRGAAQLVEQHPRWFVPAEPQLPLEQNRRNPPLVGRHQIGCPEPHRQRDLRVVQHRPGRQGHLVPAFDTSPAPVFQHRVGAPVVTAWTAEPVGPPTHRQILVAGLFGGELALKLAQVCGKGRTRHARTLHLVAC